MKHNHDRTTRRLEARRAQTRRRNTTRSCDVRRSAASDSIDGPRVSIGDSSDDIDQQRDRGINRPVDLACSSADGDAVAATASTSRDSASFTRLTASYAAPITTEIDGGPLDWRIGGQMLKESWIDELTPHTLTITFHTDRDGLEYWRQYDRAGDVQVEVGFGGTFQAVDRGGRDDALELQPPFRQTPPFDEAEFYVTNYSEAQLSSELFEIEFEFQRSEPRSGVFDVVDRSGEPWVFDFDRGTIALEERRVSRIDRDGGPTGGDTSIEVLLTDLEAAALADVAGVPDAVVDREVPDGPGFAEDTSGGRHTVAITSPDGAPLEGDWVIRNWSLAMHNRSDERWLVELQLAEG